MGSGQKSSARPIRRFGVCMGGSDGAGPSAVIRGVTKAASNDYGWRVISVSIGFDGSSWPAEAGWPDQCVELSLDAVGGILASGVSIRFGGQP